MYVVWKILGTLGCYVDNESLPIKIIFISISKLSSGTSANPYFPLRRAYFLLYVFLLYARVKVIFTPPFFILSFGKHHVLERS